MFVKSLAIRNNPLVGDIDLDFADKNGEPLNTVVIAGENGSGKSTILGMLHELGGLSLRQDRGNETREFILVLSEKEISHIKSGQGDPFPSGIARNEIRIFVDYSIRGSWDQIKISYTDLYGVAGQHPSHLISGGWLRDCMKGIYLDTEINFRLERKITSVTATSIDGEIEGSKKTGAKLAQEIAHLIVDINHQDANDVNTWVKSNLGMVVPEERIDVRMGRFSKAWSLIFPGKKYKGLRTAAESFEILFEEHGRESTIETLSSGEKQIVFRGGFILKDQNSLSGAMVFIDEPEISLHPSWQLKVLDFYRSLLTDEEGVQTSQLFASTHSPFIVHSLVDGKVIVLQKDPSTGNISVPQVAKFPGYSSDRVLAEAFNLREQLLETSQKNVVFVEGETDKTILENAWAKLYPDAIRNFEIVDAFCASHICNLLQREKIFKVYPDRKFIGLFDFDSAYNSWNGFKSWDNKVVNESEGLLKKHKAKPGYVMLLPVPATRNTYANKALGGNSTLSIEFLFSDDDLSGCTKEISLPQTTQTMKIFSDDRKVEFANSTSAFSADKFESFKAVFDLIRRVTGNEI